MAAIGIFAVIIGSIILVPFMVWGAWRRRRSDAFLPWFLYAAILFAGATFLFPVHVPGGTFIHSAIGLAPQAYILALEGVALLVAAIARRRPAWRSGSRDAGCSRGRSSGSPSCPGSCSSRSSRRAGALWPTTGPRWPTQLDRLGVPMTDRLMTIDAAGFKYATGRPGVVSPDDPIDTIHDVAEAYDIRWLVLEDGGVEALKPVLEPGRPAGVDRSGRVHGPGDDGRRAARPGALPGLHHRRRRPVRPRRRPRREVAADDPPRGLADRARPSSPLPSSSARSSPPRSSSRSPRTRPTTSAWHGTSSRAAVSSRMPSGASRRRPSSSPDRRSRCGCRSPPSSPRSRWRSSGRRSRPSQVASVIVGAIVPVLAWRLAADVAEERGMPMTRARTLAIGTGLTTAVYLPLLLHSALPDSTMPFAVLALARLPPDGQDRRERPVRVRLLDPRVIGLGLLIGLAALTRNDAIWLGLAWLDRRVARRPAPAASSLSAGAIALLVFLPWMIRDWLVFGSPLPGQAVANAFSVTGFDIFAWNDPPTLSRYLAVGPARLVQMRVDGFSHNLLTVLLLPGLPISIIGLARSALAGSRSPRSGRSRVFSLLTFLVTTLFFPVATTWGTFLHASGSDPGPDRAVGAARPRRRRSPGSA